MSEFAHDKVVPYSQSNAGKKEQVATMFDSIAQKYDFLNRFLSLGIDQSWRKKAISQFKNKKINHLLDVATGTADMALMAHRLIHPTQITGIDISEKAIFAARESAKLLNLDKVKNNKGEIDEATCVMEPKEKLLVFGPQGEKFPTTALKDIDKLYEMFGEKNNKEHEVKK